MKRRLQRRQEWELVSRCAVCGKAFTADPMTTTARELYDAYDHGHRVLAWNEPSFTVASKTSPGCGAYQVADPRAAEARGVPLDLDTMAAALAGDTRKPPPFVPLIRAADGTWHRPLTTAELAKIQGLPTEVDGRPLALAGDSVARWRERIGNAVPPPTAEAIARQMLVALVEAEAGAFSMQAGPVWVSPCEMEGRP